MLLTLGHDGGAQPGPEIVGKLVELGIAIDLNGLLGGIANNVAVVAPGKMVFKLDFCFLVEYAVQITGQLVKEFRTFHRSPSPLATSFLTSPSSFEPFPFPFSLSRR